MSDFIWVAVIFICAIAMVMGGQGSKMSIGQGHKVKVPMGMTGLQNQYSLIEKEKKWIAFAYLCPFLGF